MTFNTGYLDPPSVDKMTDEEKKLYLTAFIKENRFLQYQLTQNKVGNPNGQAERLKLNQQFLGGCLQDTLLFHQIEP